jgi:hypothetical protein
MTLLQSEWVFFFEQCKSCTPILTISPKAKELQPKPNLIWAEGGTCSRNLSLIMVYGVRGAGCGAYDYGVWHEGHVISEYGIWGAVCGAFD